MKVLEHNLSRKCRRKRILDSRVAILFFLTLVFGCAEKQQVVIGESFPQKMFKDQETSACRYFIQEVSDIRADKGTLGTVGLIEVTSEDVIAWLINGFQSAGFSIGVPEQTDSQRDILMNAALKMAHIRTMYGDKSTNLVLKIDFEGEETSSYIRGSDVSMFWAAGTSETKSAFNRSLSQALHKLRSEADTYCEEKIEASLTLGDGR